jgi:hypothetical protein
MSKEKIVTSYGFDNDTLIISFAEVVVVNIEEVEETEFNDEFETNEKVYQVVIKQKNVDKNSVTLVTESVAEDFKKSYYAYLNYRLNICSNSDAAVANLLSQSAEFFNQLEAKVERTLATIVESANEEIEKIVTNSSEILEDNRTYNKEIKKELNKLEALNNLIQNFVVEEDDVVTGELLDKEEKA